MNLPMRVPLYVFSLIFVTFFFVAGLWAIDIGASAMNRGIMEIEFFFGLRPSSQQYHLGLVVVSLCYLTIILMQVAIKLGTSDAERL